MRLLSALFAALMLIVHSTDATVLHNRPSQIRLSAFSEVLNTPADNYADTDVAINDAGELIDIATLGGTGFTIYSDTVTFLRCFDTGFCHCGNAAPTTTVMANRPAVPSPANTGQFDSVDACLIAPFVAQANIMDETYLMSWKYVDDANSAHLQHVQRLVNKNLHQVVTTFVPTQAVIITWKMAEVADGTKENDFQAILTTDGTLTYVMYIYDHMLMTTTTGNVRGFLRSSTVGGSEAARICNYLADPTMVANVDQIMPDVDLPSYTNRKCGSPGLYLFQTDGGEPFCDGGSGTSCATSYASTPTNPSCNVSTEALDTCTETYFCQRDSMNTNHVKLTINVWWYQRTYLNFLDFATWLGASTDRTNPDKRQLLVPTASTPVLGACGETLTVGTQHTFEVTIDLTETNSDNRCGIDVVTGGADGPELWFAFKIFDYDGMEANFEPNWKFDREGDLIVWANCIPDNTPLSVTQTLMFNDFSAPTAMPPRSRSISFGFVNVIDDLDVASLTEMEMGAPYLLRLCFYRGTPYNKQVDPYAVKASTCTISNKADFMVGDPNTEFSVDFITSGCPVLDANSNPIGPLFLDEAFAVRGTYTAGDPPEPFCIYTEWLSGSRWNTFIMGSLQRKVFAKCELEFCTTLDGLMAGAEELSCHDNCDTDRRRRKRMAGNDSSAETEVVYTSVTILNPKAAETTDEEPVDCTTLSVAISTIVILIALLAVGVVISLFVFLKLMRAMKMHQKISTPRKTQLTY